MVLVHALVATGVNRDGHREVLGLHITSAEDGAGWLTFFLEDRDYEVTFSKAPADVADAIDAAYEDKYPGSSAVPIMQAEGPRSATVVITPC